jgi:hypothetical protein
MGWSTVNLQAVFLLTCKRIFFLVLRGVLGILLLSDISFKSTYPPAYQFPIASAGMAPLNTSVINAPLFNQTATADFWWYFPALLTDNKRIKGVPPPDNCTAEDACLSYFLPGSMSSIKYDNNTVPITQNQYSKAIAYIQNDAPGYQIDFRQIDRVNDPSIIMDIDCQVYGVPAAAIQICLKKVNQSLLAGIPIRFSEFR